MAVSHQPVFEQTPNLGVQQILPADTTSLKTLYTGGTNGSRIMAIFLASTDTSSRDVQFVITVGGTDYLFSTLSCVARSGDTNSAAMISAFNHTQFAGLPQDANGNRYIYLTSGAILKAKSTATVTTAKAINLIVQALDL